MNLEAQMLPKRWMKKDAKVHVGLGDNQIRTGEILKPRR